jgi:hypothetical protein
VEQYVVAIRERSAADHPFHREARASHIVGKAPERLMAEHRYNVTARFPEDRLDGA